MVISDRRRPQEEEAITVHPCSSCSAAALPTSISVAVGVAVRATIAITIAIATLSNGVPVVRTLSVVFCL